jgi:hypothetical protein
MDKRKLSGIDHALQKYLSPELDLKEDDLLQMSKEDMIALDYDGKAKLLQAIASELLDRRTDNAKIEALRAYIKADIYILVQMKSAVQTSMKVEYA